MLSFIGILSFGVAVWSFWATRRKSTSYLRPSDFYWVSLIVIWSPLCFFPIEETHVGNFFIGPKTQVVFTICYSLMCLSLAAARLFFHKLDSKGKRQIDVLKNVPVMPDALRMQCAVFLVLFGTLLSIIYLSSAEYRGYLNDLYQYIKGGSLLSYSDLRRGTVYSGFVMTELHPRLGSVFILLFAASIIIGVRSGSQIVFYLAFACFIFLIGGLSFKKSPYVLYLLVGFLVIYYWARSRGVSLARVLPFAVALGALGALVIIGLYFIQYKDNQSVEINNVLEITIFRVSKAIPAGFKLYCELYPDIFEYTFGRSVGLLQPIIGYVEQPYTAVPTYFGALNTTFPSGYVSYAYADFGYIGIVFYSFVLVGILTALDRFVSSIKYREVKIIAIVAIGFATVSSHTLPLTTALLTGGLGLTPILVLAIEIYCRNSKN